MCDELKEWEELTQNHKEIPEDPLMGYYEEEGCLSRKEAYNDCPLGL
jgi:hypothetical protein